MLDSHWLPLDLTRALMDLAAGAPLSVGVLDGSADGSGLPDGLLSGRWNVVDLGSLSHQSTNVTMCF